MLNARGALFLLVLMFVGYFAFLGLVELTHNFGIVVPGQVFRSAGLSATTLEQRIKQHGIRSVINLRGRQTRQEWYFLQIATCDRLGVRHYDVGFYAKLPMSPEKVRLLLEVLDQCPKPALIHCQSGMDRTSRAAALAVLLLDGEGRLEKAKQQTSLWYGSFPGSACRRGTEAMLEGYESWLKEREEAHQPNNFRFWACRVYLPSLVARKLKSPIPSGDQPGF